MSTVLSRYWLGYYRWRAKGGGAIISRREVTIDGGRLWRWHEEMAQFGATARGGVNRPALGTADIEARRRLAELARERGFTVELDAYGNQFMRRGGVSAAPLSSGSHSDSQPTGGRFDGIFGVLAALEAVTAIDDAGVSTQHPVEAVVWTNEEGVRFMPHVMGSSVYAGQVGIEEILAATDNEGVSMAQAVDELRRAIPWAGTRELGAPLAAFLEAHIEQGPQLEAEQLQIGVVTGIQGMRDFQVDVFGEEAHSGTTARQARNDAFIEALDVVKALHAVFHGDDERVRFTIGKFQILPGAAAVVPSHVRFSIDFRHPDDAVLTTLGDRIGPICQSAVRQCDVRVAEVFRTSPTEFDAVVPGAVEQAAQRNNFPYKCMPSGASHDALNLVAFCPTGMLFVPCEKGISHNERESASPEDLAAGAQVLADALLILDRSTS